MQSFEISALQSQVGGSSGPSLEFLRVPAMSAGLYRLAAGSDDPQQPHTEDEIYYVVRGRARFRCDGEDREVAPGTVLFVPAGAAHRFHSVTEDLLLLVVFAPAKGTRAEENQGG